MLLRASFSHKEAPIGPTVIIEEKLDLKIMSPFDRRVHEIETTAIHLKSYLYVRSAKIFP